MKTIVDFQQMKSDGEKIAMITAYDFPSAQQAEEAEADVILVGDSLGMVVLGYDSTTNVTLADMVHHGKAVRRGAKDTFVVVDMPFMSYHASLEKAIENATVLFQDTNAQAIKIEGASEETLTLTKRLTEGGIPVVGHLGLTPQTVNVLGGYRVQAKDKATSQKLLDDAKQLEVAGACMIVLECIPKELGEIVTQSLSIPTIGIGAGANCDGQVLVYHDLLKYGAHQLPKFVKTYTNFHEYGVEAIKKYVSDVKKHHFPLEEHSYKFANKELLPK